MNQQENETSVLARFIRNPLYDPQLGRQLRDMGLVTYQREMDLYRPVIEIAVHQLNEQSRQELENPIIYQLTPQQEVYHCTHYDVMVFYLIFNADKYEPANVNPMDLERSDQVRQRGTPTFEFYYRIEQDDVRLAQLMAEQIYAFQEIGEFTQFRRARYDRENVYLDRFLDVTAYNGLIPIIFPVHNPTIEPKDTLGSMKYQGNVDGQMYTLDSRRIGSGIWGLFRYGTEETRQVNEEGEEEIPEYTYGMTLTLEYIMKAVQIALELAIRKYNRTRDFMDPYVQFELIAKQDEGTVSEAWGDFMVFYVRVINISGFRRPKNPWNQALYEQQFMQRNVPLDMRLDEEFYRHVEYELAELRVMLEDTFDELVEEEVLKDGYMSEIANQEMFLASNSQRLTIYANYIPLLFRYAGPQGSMLFDGPLIYTDPRTEINYHYNELENSEYKVSLAPVSGINRGINLDEDEDEEDEWDDIIEE
jgi:hypothetical protein